MWRRRRRKKSIPVPCKWSKEFCYIPHFIDGVCEGWRWCAVGDISTSTHNTTAHQYINISTHHYNSTSVHWHMNTSSQEHISRLTHQHINSADQHNTSTQQINTTLQNIGTSTHQHVITSTARSTGGCVARMSLLHRLRILYLWNLGVFEFIVSSRFRGNTAQKQDGDIDCINRIRSLQCLVLCISLMMLYFQFLSRNICNVRNPVVN